MTPYLLLLIGLLVIFIEFFTPGGFFAVAGGLIIFASIIEFAMESNSLLGTLLYIVVVAALVFLLFKFTLWRIRSTRKANTLYSDDDQAGYQASSFDQSAIGKTGVVYTDLRPGGHIKIGDNIYLAISESGYISKGEEVLVTGGTGESLTVKFVKKDKPT